MTLRETAEAAIGAEPLPVIKTTLTKAEVMNAIGYAASIKSGLRGEFHLVTRWHYKPDGELLSVEVEQTPAAPGSTGQPTLYSFAPTTLAEAAAGLGGAVTRAP